MIPYVMMLFNTVRMIHSISRYYNTSEKLSALLIKVRHCLFILSDPITITRLLQEVVVSHIILCTRLKICLSPWTDYEPDDSVVSGLHILPRSAIHLVAAKVGRQGKDPAVHQTELHLQICLPEDKGIDSDFTLTFGKVSDPVCCLLLHRHW